MFQWGLAAVGLVFMIALFRMKVISPADEYLNITNKALPNGVTAILYGTGRTDNLFHQSHFWEFEHTPDGLEALLIQLGAGPAYEDYERISDLKELDTPWILPTIGDALGKKIPLSDISRGYEIQSSSRDCWLLVSKDGTRSYLEWNGSL